jgi:subtilisin family serine protease
MKSHLIVRLRPGVLATDAPHWASVIRDKRAAPEQLTPAIDTVLRAARVPGWVTREYAPSGTTGGSSAPRVSGRADGIWSPEEVAAGLDRVYRLVLQEDRGIPASLIDDIRLLPQVERVQMGGIAQSPLPAPIAGQMSVRTDVESREAIRLPEAHRFTRGDPAIKVAVLDTGISAKHPELSGVLLPGMDFVDILDGADDFVGDYLDADADPDDDVGHGTHVAGIIASAGQRMPTGVAPRCRIIPVRVLGAMRRGDERVGAGLVDNINNAFKWAVDQGVDVISASLGVPREGGGLPHEEVVRYARSRGVTIVAAAGNDGQHALYYPGALKGVIAVGAVGTDGTIADFSTYGDQILCVAPGENIYSTYLAGDYAFSSGTSQATPFVSGAIALMKAWAREVAGATLSDAQVKHVLKHTSDRLDGRFKHDRAGYGRINVRDALRLIEHRLGRPALRTNRAA